MVTAVFETYVACCVCVCVRVRACKRLSPDVQAVTQVEQYASVRSYAVPRLQQWLQLSVGSYVYPEVLYRP